MVIGSLRHRMASPRTGNFVFALLALCSVTLVVLLLFAAVGCGGGGDDSPIVTPTASPSANPSPTPSPIISPVPSPSVSPSPTPSTPPVTGETLAVGQAVIGITDVSGDAGVSSDPVVYTNSGFAIGATNAPLGDKGTSAQVFFGDTKNGLLREVKLVIANREGPIGEGNTMGLGPVVTTIKDQNAFVIFTTKPVGDTDDSRLKQWHSSGGGTILVERLRDGQLKIRITGAQMQPRTDVSNNGQAGTFTLNGAGFAQITEIAE